MADYIDGKNVLEKRPEPGRPAQPVKQKVIQQTVDTNAIANAVIAAITSKIPHIVVREGNKEVTTDTFDNSNSMNKLADSMTVQRGNSEANFNDLGKVKENVKDKKEVDKTIDLLSNIGD
jgi:hypothetical protein